MVVVVVVVVVEAVVLAVAAAAKEISDTRNKQLVNANGDVMMLLMSVTQ